MLYRHQGCVLPEYEYIRRILKKMPPHWFETIQASPTFFFSLPIIYIAVAFIHAKPGHFT